MTSTRIKPLYKVPLFLILIIIFMLTFTSSAIIPDVISVDEKARTISLSKYTSMDAYFYLNYTEEDIIGKTFLEISSESLTSYNAPGYIYASFDEINPSIENKTFMSQNLGNNYLFINTEQLKGKDKLYINIHCTKDCNIIFDVGVKTNHYLTLEEKKVSFKLSEIDKIVFRPSKEIIRRKIMIYSLGENAKLFKMEINYSSKDVYQKFENGYGSIIDLGQIPSADSAQFLIKIIPKDDKVKDKFFEVGVELTEGGVSKLSLIESLEHVYGYLIKGENCYKVKNIEKDKSFTLLVNGYTQALTFSIKKGEEGIKEYSVDVFNNYFIKLKEGQLNEENYFCFKAFTPKEKEEEVLGEISYDFQLYYDEDLPKVQSFLFPLQNGKVYTHSLKSGEIMIYRHNSFTSYNTMYTANMLTIRGKPAMYGYTCKSYPDCNLDEKAFKSNLNNFDIIKSINQYHVNKKNYAAGNQDLYGEQMSQAREQYLTVIRCESTEDLPNKGECKYNIEIDNDQDEVQLIPEVVFATSVLTGKSAYYKIKVNDYKNIQFLNIYFTVLTGNADIYVYTDPERTKLIENKSFRHVHRKEVIEIRDNFSENYYIFIKVLETSFIEIKYDTDFYYRGYTKLNPNEVNIEYVNKEKGFHPYEIQNPDYFYPIENPKNHDFYFFVYSLDCGMTYKYNFIDSVNVTKTYHEVKSNDINFGSSFAFELKVENYFHTTPSNDEDCAMIIRAGEKSEKIPLLIVEGVPHPSNFTNTYYIYPFINDILFNGIMIEISFDKESLLEINSNPKFEVTFKIGNQKEDFEKHFLTKSDEIFWIKYNLGKYCGNNLQCSLTIEIKNLMGENNNINNLVFYTTVYNSKLSPVYIYKNQVYNQKIPPSGQRFFYTQIDADEEGEINFMFNKGSGNVFAKLVEKNKKDIAPNWNRRVQLPSINSPNILKINPRTGVIKYSSKKINNCEKGCELYILVSSQESTNKETMLNEFSFSIDKVNKQNKLSSVVDLNINNYIKGLINQNVYKFYTITIPANYKKISINFYSPYGKIYVKYGQGHICKSDSYDWKLDSTSVDQPFDRIIIVSDDKSSLKGVSFSIGIINKESENLPENLDEEELYYFLQVQGVFNDPVTYYHITSERSIICDTGENTFCHILLSIPYLYSHYNNLIYAESLSEENTPLNIMSTFYDSLEIDSKSFSENIQNYFPSNENNNQKSNGSKFLLLDCNCISEQKNNYVLLTVEVGKANEKIKIISSASDISGTYLPAFNERLIWLYAGNQINFNILDNSIASKSLTTYNINIQTLLGSGILVVGAGDYYKEMRGNYIFEAKATGSQESFQIACKNDNNEELAVIIKYEKKKLIKEKSDRLYELKKNIKNQISYTLSEESFPQYAYSKLTDNMNFEILFHGIEYKTYNLTDIIKDLFTIKGYIINERTLNKRKNDPNFEIKGDEINGTYLQYEYTGILNIISDKIKKNSNLYAYLIIDKHANNTNIYKKLLTQISAVNIGTKDKPSDITLYPKRYYFSSLSKNSQQNYILTKQSSKDKYLIIDIAEKVPSESSLKLQINILDGNNNNDDKVYSIYNTSGKKRIEVKMEDHNSVRLSLTNNNKVDDDKDKDNNNKKYMINYYSLQNIHSLNNYSDFNNSLLIKKYNKKSKLFFYNIWSYYSFSIVKVIYYIDIYKKDDLVKSFEEISSIYYGEHDERQIFNSSIISNIESHDDNFTISLPFSVKIIKNRYLVRVLAVLTKTDGSIEKYVYNSTLVNYIEGVVPGIKNLIFYVILYMALVCIIIMTIVIITMKINNNNLTKQVIQMNSMEPFQVDGNIIS